MTVPERTIARCKSESPMAFVMGEQDQESVVRLLIGESPDYSSVVLVTDPGAAQQAVVVFTPESALCLAAVLGIPSFVEEMRCKLIAAAELQKLRTVGVSEPSHANMLALTVDREKPSRLDS